MRRNITALYRSHVATLLLRHELAALGLAPDAIRVVPASARPLDAGGASAEAAITELRLLDLPEGDMLPYEERIRKGEYLVSVAVEDEMSAKVEAILRRPEEIPSATPRDAEDASVPGRDPFSLTQTAGSPVRTTDGGSRWTGAQKVLP